MGLNQRTKGVWANNLVHNLHLVTGKIGLPGSTPLSLTGQPNACGGVRDGGALSHLLPYGRLVANEKHRAEMEKLWSVPPGTIRPENGLADDGPLPGARGGEAQGPLRDDHQPGPVAAERGPLPQGARGAEGVPRRRRGVPPDPHLELADVVLPAALWAEKEGVYGCTERRYQLLEQAVKPAGAGAPRLPDPLRPRARGSATGSSCPGRRRPTRGRRSSRSARGRRTTSAA